jgi:hypothetical protein
MRNNGDPDVKQGLALGRLSPEERIARSFQPRHPETHDLAVRCLRKRGRLRRSEISFTHAMAARAVFGRPTKTERERLAFIAWRIGAEP